MRTSTLPPTTTAMTTRTSGMGMPPPIRKRVCSGEFVESENVSWNPLAPSVLFVTCTEASASMMSRPTGTGTPGPIISCSRYGTLDIRHSGHSLGKGDEQAPSDPGGQLVGTYAPVRIAETPEQLGVAKLTGGDLIEALALGHHVLADRGKPRRVGDEAAAEEG